MTGPMMGSWNRFVAAATAGAEAGLLVGSEALVDEIVETLGPTPTRSGKVYKRRSVRHTASAPGEAPAPDTGALRNSIKAVRIRPLAYRVGSSQSYAATLEFGMLLRGQREVRLMKLSTEIRRTSGFRRLDLVKERVRQQRTLQGVRFLAPRPFLRPSLERAIPTMRVRFAEENRRVTLQKLGF